MSTLQIVVLLIVLVVLAAAGAVGWQVMRRRSLRQTFGPEYDRAVAEEQSRSAAERELRERERRHAELTLRPLNPADRDRFAEQWQAVQAQFVEDPAAAVVAGDDLVTRLAQARGYPTKDFDEQLAYLSVEHARTLGHYRDAHEIFERGQRREASTEELRQALVHYRAIFADLLDAADAGADTEADRDADVRDGADYNSADRDAADYHSPDSAERNGAEFNAAERNAAEFNAAAADNGAAPRRPAPDPDPEEHAHA
jgi:hypothetical protein